jgi:hypothetical protein
LPKFVKLKFIFFAYSKTIPYAPVFEIFSDPARSMRKSLLVFEAPSGNEVWLRVSRKIRWEREECSFILVEQVILFFCPIVMILKSSNFSPT